VPFVWCYDVDIMTLTEGPEMAQRHAFDAIVGVAADAGPTDVASKERDYRNEALERRLQKKLGRRG